MKTILDAIGKTPLLELEGCFVKCEWMNPSGSIKMRVAHYIVEQAEKRGELSPGDTLVEATSGNMGNALALVAAVKGYRCELFTSKLVSRERAAIARAFGAKVHELEGWHLADAVKKAHARAQLPGFFCPNQFANEENLEENASLLAEEILQQLPQGMKIDAIVQGVGTGGTLLGVGRRFREVHNPDIALFAVEPQESQTLAKGEVGVHQIEGIADGFVPPLVARHREEITEVIPVRSQEAVEAMRELVKKRGLFVGPSSGANFVAVQAIRKNCPEMRQILTFFCDEGEKYLSEHFR